MLPSHLFGRIFTILGLLKVLEATPLSNLDISNKISSMIFNCHSVTPKEYGNLLPSNDSNNVDNNCDQYFPFLYFTYRDIPQLRLSGFQDRQISATRIHAGYGFVQRGIDSLLPPPSWGEFASRWNEQYGNSIIPVGYSYVLEPTQAKLDIAIQWLDQLVVYPNWTTKAAPFDEVTVAHILHGFVTVVDVLFPSLDPRRQIQYMATIHQHTNYLYDRSFRSFWGFVPIQNHVWTNMATLYMASKMLQHYDHRFNTTTTDLNGLGRKPSNTQMYQTWANHAKLHLNLTMLLLNYVNDGSLAEGAFYGDYSARAMTQHLHLLQRHEREDLQTHSMFLRELFNFYLYTTLPGNTRILQFADADSTWAYGPIMQLRFLDSHILQDGRANWFADSIIRAMEEHVNGATFFQPASRLSTLHAEFLFHEPLFTANETWIKSRQQPQLHYFDDWGVVTYGFGVDGVTNGNSSTIQGDVTYNTTVFAFRAGLVMGKAIHDLYASHTYSWLTRINPGHEHPDQGSFIFYPEGKPLIVSPGYTKLKSTESSNTLTFSMSSSSRDDIGQIGEGGEWFDWDTYFLSNSSVEMQTVLERDGHILLSADITRVYPAILKLLAIKRSLFLYHPLDILFVIDRVQPDVDSRATEMSALFHGVTDWDILQTNEMHGEARLLPHRLRASSEVRGYCQWRSTSEVSATHGIRTHPDRSGIALSLLSLKVMLRRNTNTSTYLVSALSRNRISDLQIEANDEKSITIRFLPQSSNMPITFKILFDLSTCDFIIV